MKKKGQNKSFSLCNFFSKNHRGQVTIFIILAIIIASSIILLVFSRGGEVLKVGEASEKNPGNFLSVCLEEKMNEAINLISSQGGYASNPLNKTFRFNDETSSTDISYLCYTNNYYTPCIVQEPMLIKHLKNEIKNYISYDVKDCFNKLASSLESQGFDAEAEYNGFEIELRERKVITNISAKLILTKSGETSSYEDLKITTLSRFYETTSVVQEIINQEAVYCNFEYAGYMLLYPQWEIDKFRTSDSVIIYTVKHKDDENKFKFAIRGCVIRPGI